MFFRKTTVMGLLKIVFFIIISLINAEQYHRLNWPSSNAELKIIPHMEIPMTMAPSVQSGMNIKMPIAMKFPTFSELLPTPTVNEKPSDKMDKAKQREDFTSLKNSSRVNSRAMFYRSIESSHPTFGKSCLMRAICEVAEIPSISSGTGLIGELVDLLLTFSGFEMNESLKDYMKAEQYGRQHSSSSENHRCQEKYKGCPFSVFNIIKFATMNQI